MAFGKVTTSVYCPRCKRWSPEYNREWKANAWFWLHKLWHWGRRS